jgi:hypothetical protein
MRALQLFGWALLTVAVSAWLAVVEVLWVPWRVGGVPVPVSLVAAVVGNLLLVEGARWLSRSRLVAVLPAVVWVVVAVGASMRRPEGDLLLPGGDALTSTLNLGFLLLGVVGAAFAVGRTLGTPTVRPPAAGSGTGGAR